MNSMRAGSGFTSRKTRGDIFFDCVIYILCAFVLLIVAYPMYFIIIASVSKASEVVAGRVWLWPVKPTLIGYKKIFEYTRIWIGYRNTIIYTVFGTLAHLIVTIPAAYALSRPNLMLKRPVMVLFTITMFFSGGLIPTYLAFKSYGMIDTLWVMIIPGCFGVYNAIIARTYFQSNIPGELLDAAAIDGCSDFRAFIRIVLPLSKAIIAVIALYSAVGNWNNYFGALIYLNSEEKIALQVVLREILILNSGDPSRSSASLEETARLQELLKYGIIIVSTLPMMLFYPFLQKYFTKGVMIGSIKG